MPFGSLHLHKINRFAILEGFSEIPEEVEPVSCFANFHGLAVDSPIFDYFCHALLLRLWHFTLGDSSPSFKR